MCRGFGMWSRQAGRTHHVGQSWQSRTCNMFCMTGSLQPPPFWRRHVALHCAQGMLLSAARAGWAQLHGVLSMHAAVCCTPQHTSPARPRCASCLMRRTVHACRRPRRVGQSCPVCIRNMTDNEGVVRTVYLCCLWFVVQLDTAPQNGLCQGRVDVQTGPACAVIAPLGCCVCAKTHLLFVRCGHGRHECC